MKFYYIYINSSFNEKNLIPQGTPFCLTPPPGPNLAVVTLPHTENNQIRNKFCFIKVLYRIEESISALKIMDFESL